MIYTLAQVEGAVFPSTESKTLTWTKFTLLSLKAEKEKD